MFPLSYLRCVHRGATAEIWHAATRAVGNDVPVEMRLSRAQQLESGLYVVSTPLGNLGDVSLRALSVLRSVACVYAEDTRHTRKLLSALEIQTPLISCHAHNEGTRADGLVRRIATGEAVALVSDAGTPGVSDPGRTIIARAVREGIRVVPIPGPTAAMTALVGCDWDAPSFLFLDERRRRLEEVEDVAATLILYVGPSDLVDLLSAAKEVLGSARKCCIAKELTKIHESFVRGSLEECQRTTEEAGHIKGELTVLVEGAQMSEIEIPDKLIRAALRDRFVEGSISVSEAVKQVSVAFGIKKRRVYKLALETKAS